jgi:hypothetical protein
MEEIKIYHTDIIVNDMGEKEPSIDTTPYTSGKYCVLPSTYVGGKEAVEFSGDQMLSEKIYVFIDDTNVFVKVDDIIEWDNRRYIVDQIRPFPTVTKNEYKRLYCSRYEPEIRIFN